MAHHGSIKGWFSVTGCSRTHSAVTLGDWSDPLDPDVETQTIYKQLLQGRDKLRSGWTMADALLLLDTRGLCCSMGVLCDCQPLLASQSYILLKRLRGNSQRSYDPRLNEHVLTVKKSRHMQSWQARGDRLHYRDEKEQNI